MVALFFKEKTVSKSVSIKPLFIISYVEPFSAFFNLIKILNLSKEGLVRELNKTGLSSFALPINEEISNIPLFIFNNGLKFSQSKPIVLEFSNTSFKAIATAADKTDTFISLSNKNSPKLIGIFYNEF